MRNKQSGLPLHRFLCYKPDMRKWMRERLQRRKKKSPEQKEQPAPPPLQPAYFDAEPEAQPAETASREAESPPPSHEEFKQEPAHEEFAAGQPQEKGAKEEAGPRQRPPSRGAAARGRTRRRRGGRGRGGRGREQAVAQAFSPAAAKGSPPASAAEVPEVSEPETEAPVPATPVSPSAPRAPKGLVVLAIGLPGSGKSTWFKRHNLVPLSSDMVRSLLFDDVREQRFQDLVFSNLRSMLKARLIAKRPMNYVDATNLTPHERQHWIKLAKDYAYEVHAVFFDVPLEVCIERHQRRDRVVPEDVMRRMAAKLKPPSFEEGFAKITVVRVKKKEQQ